jgi:S-adenosylmethionine-diacylglycerol 3-amino-3-carboxypropyl transferase
MSGEPAATNAPSRHAGSEADAHADFRSIIRYAQCWEDAQILMTGLNIQPGNVCLSIASAGENSLSMLVHDPARVIAVDLNPAQLAALELRVAAYRALEHAELLELIGSRASTRRAALYARCRSALSSDARRFWDARSSEIDGGIGAAGKFERYFETFRRRVLPLVHRRRKIEQLLVRRSPDERLDWYEREWNTWVWRTLFRIFFSPTVLGRLGRDPSFFRYVEGSVADHLLGRAYHALAVLDPSVNPYLIWILTGTHREALPYALRAENFEKIRANIDRIEWHCASIESVFDQRIVDRIDRANLSDIFEYMSPENATALFSRLADQSSPNARLAYWNMMVPRHGAQYLPERLRLLTDLSRMLFLADQTFFYREFVVDEVIA